MKKILLFVSAVIVTLSTYAQEKTVTTLNLDDAKFDYGELPYYIVDGSYETQIFKFAASYSPYVWGGFAVSKTGDKSDLGNNWYNDNANQMGCMAGGGIKSVATDGTLTVDKKSPYLVGYWFGDYDPDNVNVTFTDGVARKCKGIYVTSNSKPFYSYIHGDGYAREFIDGDCHKLIIVGKDATGKEVGSVEVVLAKQEDGIFSVLKNWKWVDLSSLGEVVGLYFRMYTTDSSIYGPNTASYFCLDRLQVYEAESTGIEATKADCNAPVEYYTLQGVRVENPSNGVFIKKQGTKTEKVIL